MGHKDILSKDVFDMIEPSSNQKLDLPQNIVETLRPFLLSHLSSAGSIFLLGLFDGLKWPPSQVQFLLLVRCKFVCLSAH